MVLMLAQKSTPLCPECGGQPKVVSHMWGNGHSVCCSYCGWSGGTTDIEVTPSAAIWHWEEKLKAFREKRMQE